MDAPRLSSERFSRFPNYFTSGVVVGQLEFSIFDAVIKKCSSDFGHQSLHEKFVAFANVVHTAAARQHHAAVGGRGAPQAAESGMRVAIFSVRRNSHMADRNEAVWDQVRGNWNQLKGKVREKWGLLTNDDIEHIAGHKDRLIGKIQERYGKSEWEAANIEQELSTLNQPTTTTTTKTTTTR